MVVQIKQIEHLERVITFNTEHIKFEELESFIKHYDVNLEEIAPSSYFDIEYKLDNYPISDTIFYYDSESKFSKDLQNYVLRRIKEAYGDEA